MEYEWLISLGNLVIESTKKPAVKISIIIKSNFSIY